ncbi:MAG: beta-ketoacyl-[acyl-carrier-protein] synthase family protein [Flavobacteriales bacterium]|nr:beta-ketoacyl-[acyl-carrier-protein] synthase family protein [Flavobacteriales bacterium]
MKRRVVITGMGVVSSIGNDLSTFEKNLRNGTSGIRHFPELEQLQFGCQIGSRPEIPAELIDLYFTPLQQKQLQADGVLYGALASAMAWRDAQLAVGETADWDSGCILGAGLAGADVIRDSVYHIDAGNTRRLGSTTVPQTMSSAISAFVGGYLGLGNRVSTNASACSTGTEAMILAAEHIAAGKAERMLAGGCDSGSPYVWAGFDAMRVTTRKHNTTPTLGSRPMSATASGFVPGGGGAALVLESLESAMQRGARIYAEIRGGFINSGGQRGGGTMTAPNPEGIKRCIQGALNDAEITARDLQLISGHLTATIFDAREVELWRTVLSQDSSFFPYLNALKGLTGHCLSASGALEGVATALQVYAQFVHGSVNCEDLHPEISAIIDPENIPVQSLDVPIEFAASSSFGFGDVNSVVILQRFEHG